MWLCLACFVLFSVRAHVLGMLFAPLLLAVATLVTIRWVIPELLPMIRCPSLALAVRSAANSLIGVIAGWRKVF